MLLPIVAILLASAASGLSVDHQDVATGGTDDLAEAYGQLPLAFEPNQGQTADEVDFMARAPGYGLYLTGERAALALEGKTGTDAAIHVNFVGANPDTQAEGLDKLPGTSNYFSGSDESEWQTNVPQYRKVRYDEVWSGIDMVFYGKQGQLEYDFVVQPGVSPDGIRLAYSGADSLRVENSALKIETTAGTLTQQAPVIYQDGPEGRELVSGDYVLDGEQVGFEVMAYDTSRPLVIDPVLLFSTVLGGLTGSVETIQDIEVDANDNVYFVGYSNGTNFPASTLPGDPGAGSNDAIVGKLSADGTTLLWATFLRGTGSDIGHDLVLDASGNVHVAGTTASANYPTTVGAFQAALSGSSDGFVSKLDPSGSTLLYSTYLGGCCSGEGLAAIDVDALGKIYVGGGSRANNFPTTSGAFDETHNGTNTFDATFAIIDPAGAGTADLIYSTVIGSNGEDKGGVEDLLLGPTGDVFLVGSTGCNANPFPSVAPVPATAIDPVCGPNGPQSVEGWAARLSPDGNGASDMVWVTFLGGEGGSDGRFELIYDAELDPDGNLVVVGITPQSNFPTTAGAYDLVGDGVGTALTEDPFVAKISADGSTLMFSTYIGGGPQNKRDSASEVEIDANGDIYIAGFSASVMPLVSPYQATLTGVTDAWLAKLSGDGSTLLFSSYFGCSGREFANALALDSSGVPIIAGNTQSADFPATPGAYDEILGGSRDAFITKMDIDAPGTHNCGDPVPEPPNNVDTTPPVITLIGGDETLECSVDTYTEQGVTATDDTDGDISGTVVIGGDTVDPSAPGTYVVTYDVSDAAGNAAAQVSRTVTVEDTTAPVITLIGGDVTIECLNDTYTEQNATASDLCDGDLTGSIVVGGTVDTSTAGTYDVTYNVSDAAGNAATEVVRTVTVLPSTLPVVTASSSAIPVEIDTSVNATADFTDAGNNEPHSASIDWGDGDSTAGTVDQLADSVSGSHTYDEAGVYTVTVTVTDSCGDADSGEYEFVVVYDPDGGFVTGGGWINSPAGAYVDDPSLTGKANFGFVSKYKKGASVPTGNTEFQFKTGDLNFHSSSYDWLVIAGQDRAKYKGDGTINGAGSYKFMITAIDNGNSGDTFHIKIWDDGGGPVIYDNLASSDDDDYDGTVIGGGNIKVHKK